MTRYMFRASTVFAQMRREIKRSLKGRWTRWEDPLQKFCKEMGHDSWMLVGANTNEWNELAAAFTSFIA